MNQKILFVGGTFDKTGGKPSKIVRQLAYGLYETVNGGSVAELRDLVKSFDDYTPPTCHCRALRPTYDAIIWMPNISNDEEKLLPKIKKKSPHTVLISSKRNTQNKYSYVELVDRALKSKSQLLIEISDSDSGLRFRLVDPLGNVSRIFFKGELQDFRDMLYEKIQFLLRMKRIGSGNDAGYSHIDPPDKPQIDSKFLEAITGYADKFHDLIHGENENPRFMGNVSFRCTKGGFPSQRNGDAIYVSRRNVDKRSLDAESFVAVAPHKICERWGGILYWGEHKPSVDTPIQIQLYDAFPKINYMLHAHVYYKGATMTNRYVPCGDTREVAEVVNVVPNPKVRAKFAVNLKGHGCLIASAKVKDLLNLEDKFYARPTPEETL